MDTKPEHLILIPDSGPLLELLRSDSLNDLFVPFASLAVPDAVLHELLRSGKEEGHAIAVWVKVNNIPIFDTRTFAHGQCTELRAPHLPQGALVDLCLQEIMNEINLSAGKTTGIFLLEEHKCIGKHTFFAGAHCKNVTLKAFRKFLSGVEVSNPQANQGAPLEAKPDDEHVPLSEPAPQGSPTQGGGFLTAVEAANPKLIEKRLRELAGQTTQLSRKTIDAFKARSISKPSGEPKASPDANSVEKFRKSLM